MKIIIGLGNIGKEYEKTRHNAGFMGADKIAESYGFESFALEEKFESEISKGEIKNEKIVLAKPQTFMNASGRAVQKIINFYKAEAKDMIVIHDDLDIMLGDFRLAFGRSSAGHKGVQSIIDCTGTKEFHRIRIGIKTPERKIPTEKYVLGNFSKEEIDAVQGVLDKLPETIEKELII